MAPEGESRSRTPIGRLSYGLDAQRDRVDTFSRNLNPDGSVRSVALQGPVADCATYDMAGLFLQSETPLHHRLDLLLGGRYAYARADAPRATHPRIAIRGAVRYRGAMSANAYLILILALLVAHWVLELIVETLNLRHADPEIPAEFADCYDAERYAKAQRYLRETTPFGLLQSTLMLPVTIAFILLGGFTWLHAIAQGAAPNSIVLQGLVFAGMLTLLGQLVALPFNIVDTFVIESRYGFNTTTVRTFIVDRLKGLLLMLLIGVPVFALIVWLFDSLPYAWFWAWGALAVIQFIMLVIAPVVILPMFNTFTPLEPGPLREALETYAVSQDYRLSGIFKIDGSRRSTRSNAYFTGIGRTKRIALYDTLIERHTPEELTAVLAHEVGHCKRGHVRTGLAVSLGASLLMFGILALFITQPNLYAAFGIAADPLPVYAGLIFFGFLYAPVNLVIGLLGNILSRRHEYAADAFAARTTGQPEAMIAALKQLSVHNLSNLTPHPLKVFLEYSHPPVLQRLAALRDGAGLSAS